MNEIIFLDLIEKKDIPNYSGYKISRDGRVYSSKRGGEKELTPSNHKKGYLKISLRKNGKRIYELIHRLVYQTFVGEIPKEKVIDHIDRDKRNNNLSNLRLVSYSENSTNSRNVDIAKGYSFNKEKGKWNAVISINGKQLHLGYFNTEDEARKAYLNASKTYRG